MEGSAIAWVLAGLFALQLLFSFLLQFSDRIADFAGRRGQNNNSKGP